MIKINETSVEIEIPVDTPIKHIMHDIDKEAFELTSIQLHISTLFKCLIQKYGKKHTLRTIAMAMHDIFDIDDFENALKENADNEQDDSRN